MFFFLVPLLFFVHCEAAEISNVTSNATAVSARANFWDLFSTNSSSKKFFWENLTGGLHHLHTKGLPSLSLSTALNHSLVDLDVFRQFNPVRPDVRGSDNNRWVWSSDPETETSSIEPVMAASSNPNQTQAKSLGILAQLLSRYGSSSGGSSYSPPFLSSSSYGSLSSYASPHQGGQFNALPTTAVYYPPPLPPLPSDGVIAPVYQPQAKVIVSADFVELKCNVFGDVKPLIRWVKLNGYNPQGHLLFSTIAEGPRVLYDNYHYIVRTDGRSSRLIIRDPDPRVHYGNYQCQATVAGTANHIAKDDFVVGGLL